MARDGPDHLVKKAEREGERVAAVERGKARSQEARDRLRAPLGDQRIGHPMAMAQQVDPCEGSPVRTGHRGFTMPGRPIHPDSSVYLSQDDPVIAQDHDPTPPPPRFGLPPPPGHGPFSRGPLTLTTMTLTLSSPPTPRLDVHP